MLNRSASLAMSTSVPKALPDKLDNLSKDTHLELVIYTIHLTLCVPLDSSIWFIYYTWDGPLYNLSGHRL